MRVSTIVLDHPAELITPSCADWPSVLAELPKAPLWLHRAGALPDLGNAVAIVGTRFADEEALRFATELASQLADSGRVVISGGARGIDAAAHRGALAAGGKTIAVLATGLTHAYPPEHAELFATIARQGCLLSEEPAGAVAHPGLFLKRNRIVAALATSVVVVQAPLKSGALATARIAAKLKKPLFAVPYTPWEERGAGCLWLLRQGALICTSVVDVLSVRPSAVARAGNQPRQNVENANSYKDMDDLSRAIVAALDSRARHPDELCRVVGLPVAELHSKLLQLVLLGAIEPRADGTYAKH